jgi:hypothetical protein
MAASFNENEAAFICQVIKGPVLNGQKITAETCHVPLVSERQASAGAVSARHDSALNFVV